MSSTTADLQHLHDPPGALRPRPAAEPTPRALAEPLRWPAPSAFLAGSGGFAALGLVAVALGGDLGHGPLHLAAFIAPLPIALATTQLTLLVAHQWLGLPGRPEDLPRAAAHAWCGGGRLALGVVPLLLWFATTSDPSLFRVLAGLLTLGTGGATLLGAAGRVRDAVPGDGANPRAAADLLSVGWFGLASAVFLLLSHSLAGTS